MTVFAHPETESSRALIARRRLLCLAVAAALPAHAAPAALTALSLEQLLEATIVGASKCGWKRSEVAAAVSVITRRAIQTFGRRTLADALASLPGVHTTYGRQHRYLGTRGFGVPGDDHGHACRGAAGRGR